MISIRSLSDTLLTHCKRIETLEVQVERELNALLPTTAMIRLACFGKYPTCALASITNTSVVAEGGCKGYQSYCIDTLMSKRSVHERSRSKEAHAYVSREPEPMHSGVFGSSTIRLN